jgi:hypothetical protein
VVAVQHSYRINIGHWLYSDVSTHLFMRHILCIFAILTFYPLTAQRLVVTNSQDAAYLKGRKLRAGDRIDLQKKVRVSAHGQLGLEYGRWTFYLKPGTYDMDSVLRGQKSCREFIVDDSIYSILTRENLLHCRKSGIQCMDVNALSNPNYKKHDNTIIAKGGSVRLKWDDRPEYKGSYYVVFSTMFDELIHMELTEHRELEVDLTPFQGEKFIIYKVISRDCIESDPMTIKIE